MCCKESEVFSQDKYKNMVRSYISSYKLNCDDENTLINLKLKEDHTFNVTEHCLNIAKSENLSRIHFFIAFLCGLFHDIGRFEQFTKYKTFRDDKSLYHGALGVEIIEKEGFLKDLPTDIQKIVIEAVLNHGLKDISKNTTGDALYFSKLVRDADKADIYRIVVKYYNRTGPRNIVLEYGLENLPIISDKVFESFRSKKIISKTDLKTLNDFKLMQISWIYDINFKYTRDLICKNNYTGIILSSMNCENDKAEIERIVKEVLV